MAPIFEDIGRVPRLLAALYTRRSREDQSSYSPAAQERIGRTFCEQNQLKLVKVYLDDDYSGTIGERPEFEQMQVDARVGRFQVIVVPKMDRFARDTILALQTYDRLRQCGVLVVSVNEFLNFDTPMGRKFLTDSASTAEWYSRNLATEVKKGLRQKYETGAWVGPLPLGYEPHYERDSRGERIRGTGRAIQNGDAPTARLIFDLYATGNYSDLSLAEELNRRGYTAVNRSGRVPFQRDTIGGILTNTFYVGLVRYKDETRPGVHEPIVSQDVWDQVQAIRAGRARNLGGRVSYRVGDGLLMDLGHCARCGAVLHWNKAQRRQGYYWCSSRRKYGTSECDAPLMPATLADPAVLAALHGLVIQDTLRDAVIQVVHERLRKPIGPQGVTVDTLNARLRRLRDLYELGDLDRREYIQKRTEIERLIARFEATPAGVQDVAHAFDVLQDLGTIAELADMARLRALIRQLLDVVWVEKTDAGQIAVRAIKPAPSYALLLPAVADLSSMVTPTGFEPVTFSSGG